MLDYLPYKIYFLIKSFGFGSKQQQEKLHCTHRTFGGMYQYQTHSAFRLIFSQPSGIHSLVNCNMNWPAVEAMPDGYISSPSLPHSFHSLLDFSCISLAKEKTQPVSFPLYKRISSSVQTENFLFSDTTFLDDFDLNFHMPRHVLPPYGKEKGIIK